MKREMRRTESGDASRALLCGLGADEWIEDGNGLAAANRSELAGHGVVAVNLMGGPASGRTQLVEATARALAARHTGVVLAGPTAEAEARRLVRSGLPACAITSRRQCHVDAEGLDGALQEFAWRCLDYLFVENVGGLVGPAFHDLGESVRVATLSVTEGAEQPLKYPDVFRSADLVVVTKADLLPFLPGVSLEAIVRALACVMRRPAFVVTSAATGQGLDTWIAWLERRRSRLRGVPSPSPFRAMEPSALELVSA